MKTLKKLKVSVYLSDSEKDVLKAKADSVNLSISTYLLNLGLEKSIDSSKSKAKVVSTACQIYQLADEIESPIQRDALKRLAGELYGDLEDKM